MKKNNKGFFLVEAIVIIALVTIVMAYVYPNVSKLYDNFVKRSKYYDQTEDLYTLRAYNDLIFSDDTLKSNVESKISGICTGYTETEVGAREITGNVLDEITLSPSNKFGELEELYITGYMADPRDSDDYNFNRYLLRLKKTTNDKASYRLIGRFVKKDEDENVIETRYASIKIDNPNPNRHCNLGG